MGRYNSFSLHPVKIITTGEGGVVTTNSQMYHKKLKIFREHGIIRYNTKRNGSIIKSI